MEKAKQERGKEDLKRKKEAKGLRRREAVGNAQTLKYGTPFFFPSSIYYYRVLYLVGYVDCVCPLIYYMSSAFLSDMF